jgi:acetyl esterase/lipase
VYTCSDMLPLTSDQVFMTFRRPLLWMVLLSATAANALLCQQTIEVEVRRGVIYATHDGIQLSGDHYVPKQPGKYPVVVAIHGGGWQLGSRGELQNWGQYLASHGIACFSIDYRLSKPGQRNLSQAGLRCSGGSTVREV